MSKHAVLHVWVWDSHFGSAAGLLADKVPTWVGEIVLAV